MKYNKDNPLNVVTLCSGYDAQFMALERLKKNYPEFDFKKVAWAEIDKYACQAHNAVFPEIADKNLGDITTCDWSQIKERVDLLFYSTPCQSLSLVGKQEGIKKDSGTASSVIWSVLDAIDTLKPKYLCLENVKNFVSKKFIGDFKDWCKELEKRGYVNTWQVLNAKDYGVPQNRERVFLFSIKITEDDPFPKYNFPKPFPLQKKLKDVLETNVDEKYYLSDKAVSGFMKTSDNKEHCHKFAPKNGEDTAFTIRTKAGSRVDDNFINENNIGGD